MSLSSNLNWDSSELLLRFIAESNLIDPQYDADGNVIPGSSPGEEMFDRQMAAWEVFCYYRDQGRHPESVYLDAHREMTRGLELFERRGMSGVYRDSIVRIGGTPPLYEDGETTLDPSRIESVIRERLMPELWAMIETSQQWGEFDDPDLNFRRTLMAAKHHCQFECIHPFWDGNGRIGRLGLLDASLRLKTPKPPVIEYSQREYYYQFLQGYRAQYFDAWLGKDIE